MLIELQFIVLVDPLSLNNEEIIVNIVKKHQKQRDAPFNGPIVYSTIESIRSEIRGRNLCQRIVFSRPTTKTQNHMDELERLDEIQSEQNKRKSLDIDAMIEGMFRKTINCFCIH